MEYKRAMLKPGEIAVIILIGLPIGTAAAVEDAPQSVVYRQTTDAQTPASSPFNLNSLDVTQAPQFPGQDRYKRLSPQLKTALTDLDRRITAVRASGSIELLDDGSSFISWSPAITLQAGLSVAEQEAIARQAIEVVLAFQYQTEGSLLAKESRNRGGILLFIEQEEPGDAPRATNVGYRILSYSPEAAEFRLRVDGSDGAQTADMLLGRLTGAEDGDPESWQFVAIAPDQPDPRETAERLFETGQTQLKADNLSAARQPLEKALTIYRSLPDTDQEFRVLDQLLTLYDRLGDTQQVNAVLQRRQAIALSRQDSLALRAVGSEFKCRGQWDQAVATYQSARATYRQDRPEYYFSDSARILELELATLAEIAQTLIQANRLTEAERVLREAITLLDTVFDEPSQFNDDDQEIDKKIRQFTEFFNSPLSSSNLYLMLQWVLIEQGRSDEALTVIEQGRTQALEALWTIKQGGERLPRPTLPEMQRIARRHDATLVTYSFNTVLDSCTYESLDPELLTWVIPPDGEIRFHRQPVELSQIAQNDQDIQKLVQDTRTVLGARGVTVIAALPPEQRLPRGNRTSYLRSLHQLLIDPIKANLSDDPSDRVIFIPDFALFMVPFPALQASDGDYLIEDHTILTAPSIQALALTARSRQQSLSARTNPLIVGNPTYSPMRIAGQTLAALPPLPGAEQEAIAVAKLLGTQALTGDRANKSAILKRIGQAGLLHFATHGFLEGASIAELPGSLAVAQSGTLTTPPVEIPGAGLAVALSDDGLITTSDLLYFRLRAELAVLSACNTGSGDLTGDGVTGLSRALIAAGVPSVMVSLWSVPDAPTGELMEVFYREWLQSGDKAQALRTAMLTTLKKHPNPINWAAFTLIGEAD